MNNIHALWDNLLPLNEVDRDYFDGCKEHLGQDSNILWYPSSGGDFHDLIHTHPALEGNREGRNGMTTFPDLFIHTDYHPTGMEERIPRSCFQRRPPPWPRMEQEELGLDDEPQFLDVLPPPPPPHNTVPIQDDGQTRIEITRLVPLVFSDRIRPDCYSAGGRCSEKNWLAGKAAFMEMSICSNRLGRFTRYLLYLFCDNCSFFEELVLARGLKISHLVHVRDGAGYGGGWVQMDFLHRFLGFMGVEYLITDYPFPTGTNRFMVRCRRARRVLHSPGNPRTDRIEVGRVPCDLAGVGSAPIYRVRREPTILWGRTRRRMERARGTSIQKHSACWIAGRRPA